MKRDAFIKKTAVMGMGLMLIKFHAWGSSTFPVVRVPEGKRKFKSKTIEDAITEFQSTVKDKELAWLFGNCFPNTLDTTVTYSIKDGKPDTYVITGDIDAMWLRDSSAQVWPYLPFIKKDKSLQQLIAGVINRQTSCILLDPYANAFYNDTVQVSPWKNDLTDMKPGIHERRWELDSLCYTIRLAYGYWQFTGDTTPFDAQWKQAVVLILKTFKDQQRKNGNGLYHYQRKDNQHPEGSPANPYGPPMKPIGLICSAFRPSDDVTTYSFHIPSNFFAVASMRKGAKMISAITGDNAIAEEFLALATEVENALKAHAIFEHKDYGKIYAYEINGLGDYNIMDDANIPSLLSLPYLDAMPNTDPIYQNTRRAMLSSANPYFCIGTVGEGIGGPHAGKDMIWPLGIITRGMTSRDDKEIKQCIDLLKKSNADTGFIHEAFNKDDPSKFTRTWFAWANTLFGEFIWKTYKTKPHLLA
jgi:meiotically up-regulated gene 157 (Mug157) protein